MLQKLPTVDGDTITLGTLVAIGITPAPDRNGYVRFASFDRNGMLVSYIIEDNALHRQLLDEIETDIVDYAIGERDNIKYTITPTGGWRVDFQSGRTVISPSAF